MMNRIRVSPPGSDAKPQLRRADAGETAAVYRQSTGDTPHALFTPLHYEPNYAYPLLVWLHGPGGDENQLKRIIPFVSIRNYVGIAVRGTVSARDELTYSWSQSRSHVALAEQRVFDAVSAAQAKMNIHPNRIFLAGFDEGGTMAFRLAMAHPATFAGVLSVAGEFPLERTPLVRLNDLRSLPVFLACGRDSRRYPPSTVCDNLRLLHSAGLSVTLRQYPCGHELSPHMLADMDRWIMEQVTAPCANAH